MKTLLKIVLLAGFLISMTKIANAQKPITWQKVLNNTDICTLSKTIQTSDKGYLTSVNERINILPRRNLSNFNKNTDKFGNRYFNSQSDFSTIGQPSVTWQKIYNGKYNSFDGGMDICLADSGNLYIVGFTTILPNLYKIWLLKVNKYGDTIWTKSLGNNGAQGYAITMSNENGCIITGGSGQAFLINVNKNGEVVWERYYGGSGVQCYDILGTIDGGYICCGRINFHDGFLLKTDYMGNFQWQKIYSIKGFKAFSRLTSGINGGYIVSGYESPDTAMSTSTVTRIDDSGNVIWSKNYDSGGGDIFPINNGYVIGGAIHDDSVKGVYGFMKIDTTGILKFQRAFDSTDFYGGIKFVNPNKYVIATGTISGFSLFGKVILCDSSGNLLNRKVFKTPDFIEFKSILPLSNGDIAATGICDFDFNSFDDVFAARMDSLLYAPPLIKINNNELTNIMNFELLPNYPNPFNSSTIIQYNLKTASYMKLEIFDLMGKTIEILEEGKKYPGLHKYNLQSDKLFLSSGVYFIGLTSNSQTFFKKIILIK